MLCVCMYVCAFETQDAAVSSCVDANQVGVTIAAPFDGSCVSCCLIRMLLRPAGMQSKSTMLADTRFKCNNGSDNLRKWCGWCTGVLVA